MRSRNPYIAKTHAYYNEKYTDWHRDFIKYFMIRRTKTLFHFCEIKFSHTLKTE